MMRAGPGWDRARTYARGAVAVGLLAGGVTALGILAWGRGTGSLPWAALGWAPMVAVGIGSGTWMAASYGRPSAGFLAGMVAGILGRLLLAAVGAAAVVMAGGSQLWPFLAGWAGGFVPLQAYEIVFFHRAARAGRGA